MNLVRHQLGLSRTETRFPAKGTCLAIYSRAVNAQAPLAEVLGRRFPWCAGWSEQSCVDCLPPMSRPSRRRTCSITTTCCSTGRRWRPRRTLAAALGERFDHILVDEYQDTNRLQASILPGAEARRPRRDGGRRRRPVDLFLPRRRNAQHPGFPQPISRRRPRCHARPQLPLDRRDPGRRQCGDRRGRERFTKNLWTERRLGRRAAAGHRARRSRPGQLCLRQGAGGARGRHGAERAGGAVPRLASQRPAGDRADAPQHPVREIRRAEIPRCRPCQGRAGGAALCRKPARPRRRLSRAAAVARHRPVERRRMLDRRRRRKGSLDAAIGCRVRAPHACRGRLAACSVALSRAARRPAAGRPTSNRSGSGTSRISSASTRMPPMRRADLLQLEQIASGYPSRERFLTDLTLDPPDATSDRAGPPHRDEDYPDPLDDPFGQGPGVEERVRAQLRRRLHPVGSRRRHAARRSRRSGGCSTSP